MDKDGSSGPESPAAALLGLRLGGAAAAADTPPPQGPIVPSDTEAECYYAGLPSQPLLVSRSGPTQWFPPDPGAPVQKAELCNVGEHPFNGVWDDKVGYEVHNLLCQMNVDCSAVDVVRIKRGDSVAPAVLWIGVEPGTLTREHGAGVVRKCLALLGDYADAADIEVEIREARTTTLAAPKFLDLEWASRDTPYGRPLTSLLGMPICARASPSRQGTGGLFFTAGEQKDIYLLTARHVVLDPASPTPGSLAMNVHYPPDDSIQPPHRIMLFGDKGYEKFLESSKKNVAEWEKLVVTGADHLRLAEEQNRPVETFQARLESRKLQRDLARQFDEILATSWNTDDDRELADVVCAPPVAYGAGVEGCTEDWAASRLHPTKIDDDNFKGNVISLAGADAFVEGMNDYRTSDEDEGFKRPSDDLLRLRGIISDHEMRHPTQYNDGKELDAIMVGKDGSATGLTVGRANEFRSFVRWDRQNLTARPSKEWAVLAHGEKAFAAEGDSGAVVFDGRGRAGGLLTGGVWSQRARLDVAYATPIGFIFNRMHSLYGLRDPRLC